MQADDTAERVLTHAAARTVYNRLGAFLDSQRVYEDAALRLMVAHGRFDTARSVFEFGCGTGRLAVCLLSNHLPAAARYVGVDVSPVMVRLATRRLQGWAGRTDVRLTGGSARMPDSDATYDRFVSTYVLDLLAADDIADVLNEAHRLLNEHGLLGVVSLTRGTRGFGRLVARAWTWLHHLHPAIVGGCRPLRVGDYLAESRWQITYRRTVVALGMTSEVVVAARRDAGHAAPRD